MSLKGKLRFGAACAVAPLLVGAMAVTSGVQPASAASSSPAVKTVVVAGLGTTFEFGAATVGAQAFFNQVNASGELKGVKIKYIGFTDDGATPATALTAVRQLVTQQHIFAIVPDMSFYNPASYLASQKVPYVGLPLDATYCSSKPNLNQWGVGIVGCISAPNPPRVPDRYASFYTYVKGKTSTTHPTLLAVGTDNPTGQSLAAQTAAAAKGAGFKVVSAKGNVPTQVSDWTPYVTQWMTASNGKPPQSIVCLAAANCIGAWTALKAVGYKGSFFQPLGNIASIAKAMAGTVTTTIYNTAPTPALTQMQDAMNSVAPNTQLAGSTNVPGYLSASMFVQALKKVGNNDTPQAVQKVLATQTWQIKGLAGPTAYPSSMVISSPWCSELVSDNADGSGYTIVSPYSCTSKTYKY
jgi:ABC-type branched-subunit amino acid transport system substrate-binding protein